MPIEEKHRQMADEKLLELLRMGNDEIMDYLLEKYKNMVRKKARAMFLVGGDTDDLIQEGMIGLYKAIRDFRSDKDASFSSFANLCINRQIYTAINASQRKKHAPLNGYISFDGSGNFEKDESNSIMEAVSLCRMSNPEEILIDKENTERIELEIEKRLSSFEKEVLRLYMEGSNYNEIAEQIDKSPKSIDNALQRIKAKVMQII
ncbi:RNA polymerase sporulation sigma factor SigH [Parasporobacterium paucivorans]|uniref:RNA polymerase sigma factor SigS n=1 Tax=Parasporobacterium paucivorans DSM 15970 TaxID=1122934 RepID=A0A1M6FQZ9_9FIRM|nr:RNA polymerase sporulation sigma factor SigH [Parasporobacterium paucivorans]SHJ00158.1 RNA polymerase sporulation-specific sigma factor [Parasporobacterium paucivorans DSM 15970]